MRSVVLAAALCPLCFLCFSLAAEEPAPAPTPSVTIGGGVFLRYLHLELSRWKYASGNRLPDRDLAFSGGYFGLCGPVGAGDLRWRSGVLLGYAGDTEGDEVGDLEMGLVAGGITSGLSWRPDWFGVSLGLTVGVSGITTEIKEAELDDDWNLFERRVAACFYWEPLLSFDFQVADIFVIRVEGGYSFFHGKGEEIGGATAGIAFDFGQWI